MDEAVRRRVAENRAYLTKLDGAIGDGDHGTNMDRGMKKVAREARDLGRRRHRCVAQDRRDGARLERRRRGRAPLRDAVPADGPGRGRQVRPRPAPDSRTALDAGVQGVIKRGKAEPGDKTMLDALGPALEALREAGDDRTSPARSGGRRRPPARAWRRPSPWSRAKVARATWASAAPATRTRCDVVASAAEDRRGGRRERRRGRLNLTSIEREEQKPWPSTRQHSIRAPRARGA